MRFLVIFFFAELFVSIKVGITIGFFWSVVWILVSMFVGITLLRLSPYALSFGFENFTVGKFDLNLLNSSSIAYFLGAILLIIPGVLSDVMGLFLLFWVLYLHLFVKISNKDRYSNFENFKGDNNVIDTEIIDEYDSSNRIDKCRKF